jgi:hypothetical protein
MGLVDQRRPVRPLEVRVPPAVRLIRLPDLGVENQGGRILHHPAGIGRDAVAPPPLPVNAQAVKIPMVQRVGRQDGFPTGRSFRGSGQTASSSFQPEEIPHQVYGRGIGRPFPESPPIRGPVKAEVLMTRCQIQQVQQPAVTRSRMSRMCETPGQRRTVGLEVRIGIDQSIDKGVDGNHEVSLLGV